MDFKLNEYSYKIPRQYYIDTIEQLNYCMKLRYNIIRKLKTENKRWEIFSYRKHSWFIDFKNNFIGEI